LCAGFSHHAVQLLIIEFHVRAAGRLTILNSLYPLVDEFPDFDLILIYFRDIIDSEMSSTRFERRNVVKQFFHSKSTWEFDRNLVHHSF